MIAGLELMMDAGSIDEEVGGELQSNIRLLIVYDFEMIKLQMQGGGVKVMMVVMFLCDCRWIERVSEKLC